MTQLFQSRTAYRVLTSLLALFLPVWLKNRVKHGKEDTERFPERYGKPSCTRPSGELIWLHGASVGETQMLRSIMDRLLEKPNRTVLITSGTHTSAKLLADQLPDRAIHQYVPLDTPRATARFITHWRPNLAVFAESELWPNLIWAAQRDNIPLALINARMNEKSIESWSQRPDFARSVIGAFDTILASDKNTSDGLSDLLGETIPDIGSLKLDAPALDYDREQYNQLKAQIGQRKVWLAASTHEAEEEIFHRFYNTLKDDAYMIWLPRHPERGHAIANRLGTTPRSGGGKPRGHGYIMDTLGEMGLALALADVCVLGGSYHPSLMGHNPLEAARAGVPVITGPYHASFVQLFRKLDAFNAVVIADDREVASKIREGLSGQLDAMRVNAQGFAAETSGTLDRTIEALEQLLRDRDHETA